MDKIKKRYTLLVLDIIACFFFLCMLWISYEKDLGNTFKYTWIIFIVVMLFNTISDVRKLLKTKNSGLLARCFLSLHTHAARCAEGCNNRSCD